MFSWMKRRKWLLVNAVLVGVLVSLLGVQVVGEQDVTDQSVKIGVGNEKVITLGHIAYAAGSVDYTYDGVDDNVQFQAALDALPATGGRLIDVSAVQKNFSSTVTRAIANVIIEGSGLGSYFTNDGTTAIFAAGGNGWVFTDLRTDAGGISMGATTGWMWTSVDDGVYYAYRSPYGQSVFNTANITTLNAPTGRGAAYVVASANATDIVKAQADFVCDGVADDVQIQAAVDALSIGSRTVVILAGTYNTVATVTASNNTVLVGAGMANTIIKGSTAVLLDVGGACLIRDIGFDGESTSTSPIRIMAGSNDSILERVWVDKPAAGGSCLTFAGTSDRLSIVQCEFDGDSVASYGITTTGGILDTKNDLVIDRCYVHDVGDGIYTHRAYYTRISNCKISSCSSRGVYAPAYSQHVTVANCRIDSCGGTGLRFCDDYALATGNTVSGCGSHGILLCSGYYQEALGNQVTACGKGISVGCYYSSGGYQTVANNICYNNSQDGIAVLGSTGGFTQEGIIVEGNHLIGNTDYGLRCTEAGHNGTVQDLSILSNYFSSNGIADVLFNDYSGAIDVVTLANSDLQSIAFTTTPTNLRIYHNLGYITENSGTASLLSGNTTVVVAHGLAATPTTITVTWLEDPTNAIGDWWVDNIGSANFTLNGADPGASNLDFLWEAKVR